jgi:hypothetical protein
MTNPDEPWLDEPDEYDFTDEATGLPIALRRNQHLKHWCGYIGVPEDHPWYGMGYDEIDVSAHGGVTYADKAYWGDTRGSHWFGFDCAHSGDLVPGLKLYGSAVAATAYNKYNVYRDLEYVKAAAIRAAADIAAVAPKKKKIGFLDIIRLAGNS